MRQHMAPHAVKLAPAILEADFADRASRWLKRGGAARLTSTGT